MRWKKKLREHLKRPEWTSSRMIGEICNHRNNFSVQTSKILVQNKINYPTIRNSLSYWEGSPPGWYVSSNWNGSIPLVTKGQRRGNLCYNLAKRYGNTVPSAPHNILYKLFWKTADLKLMPMAWKPKQCKSTNFKETFLRGKKHLVQITAEIKNFVSLAVEKKIKLIFGFSLL